VVVFDRVGKDKHQKIVRPFRRWFSWRRKGRRWGIVGISDTTEHEPVSASHSVMGINGEMDNHEFQLQEK